MDEDFTTVISFPAGDFLSTDPILISTGNTAISVEAGYTVTLGGVVSDSGGPFGFAKIGAGILELAVTNTYTGPTTVKAGKLIIDGLIDSATTVESGATLGGTGRVGDLIVEQ